MQAIRTAINWLLRAEQPEVALIRHLGFRHESGIRFMPVSESSRFNLPVFVFFKKEGAHSADELVDIRAAFEGVSIVSEFIGPNSFSLTVNVVANPTIVRAYNAYMAGLAHHSYLETGWDEYGTSQTVLPEGWTW